MATGRAGRRNNRSGADKTLPPGSTSIVVEREKRTNHDREESSVAAKPFASSADLGEKEEILEVLGDGVYALTAGGDPNVGVIEGEDFVVAFEARATPVMAQQWLDKLRGEPVGARRGRYRRHVRGAQPA